MFIVVFDGCHCVPFSCSGFVSVRVCVCVFVCVLKRIDTLREVELKFKKLLMMTVVVIMRILTSSLANSLCPNISLACSLSKLDYFSGKTLIYVSYFSSVRGSQCPLEFALCAFREEYVWRLETVAFFSQLF